MSEPVAAPLAAVDLRYAEVPHPPPPPPYISWLGAEADACCVAHADAMPVEIVQFCWQYNLERLQNLPEVRWKFQSRLHASDIRFLQLHAYHSSGKLNVAAGSWQAAA